MKDKVILLNKIDYLFEGYQLLQLLAANKVDEYDKFKQSVLEKYGSDSTHTRATLDLVERILERASEVFQEDAVKLYFSEIENEIIPAELVMCWYAAIEKPQDVERTVADIRKEYEQISAAEYDMKFFKELEFDMDDAEFDRVVGCEERGIIVESSERMRNIFNYIQKMDIKMESKMRIQDIYLNRDAYVEPICELWEKACTLLHEYEDEMQSLCDEWAEYWQKIVEDGSFLPMLGSIVEMDQDAIEKGVCILPTVVQCAGLMVYVYGKLIPMRQRMMTTCRMGVLLGEEFNWNSRMRDNEGRWEEMQPVFKALGDGSKADILMFIKDKSAYGSEIAKKFSLTTATVSHHMNKLVQLRIVQTEMRDGRVYYQAKKDTLREMFEQCRRMFE